MSRIAVLALLGALAAASHAAAAPARPSGPEFASCTWGEVRGRALSIWSFACGPAQGDTHLEADDALPGFVLVSGQGPERTRRVVVRVFAKPAAAPMAAILPAVRAASPGPATAACMLVPDPALGRGAFAFEPTGQTKTAWDRAQKTGDPTPPPCGVYGPDFDRAPTFTVLKGRPDRVVFADMGSEIQIFHPETLKVVDGR